MKNWVLLASSYGFKCVYVAQVVHETDCHVWVKYPRRLEAVEMSKPEFYHRMRRTIKQPACCKG